MRAERQRQPLVPVGADRVPLLRRAAAPAGRQDHRLRRLRPVSASALSSRARQPGCLCVLPCERGPRRLRPASGVATLSARACWVSPGACVRGCRDRGWAAPPAAGELLVAGSGSRLAAFVRGGRPRRLHSAAHQRRTPAAPPSAERPTSSRGRPPALPPTPLLLPRSWRVHNLYCDIVRGRESLAGEVLAGAACGAGPRQAQLCAAQAGPCQRAPHPALRRTCGLPWAPANSHPPARLPPSACLAAVAGGAAARHRAAVQRLRRLPLLKHSVTTARPSR